MPATKTQLTGGVFQDSEGNVLNAGYLLLKLNQDNSVPGVGNICSGIEVKIILNSSGSVDTITPQYVWATDVMTVTNAFYTIVGYTAAGQRAWGPNNQQVTSAGVGGGTFDCGLWVPNQVYSWTPSGQPTISLRTNGTPNLSQVIQNLESTNGSVVLTDLGSGNIDLAASGLAFSAAGNGWLAPTSFMPFVPGTIGGVTTAIASGSSVANQVGSVQFILPYSITIRAIAMYVVTGGGVGFATAAIYDKTGTTKLVDAGANAFDTHSASQALRIVNITPVTLPAGIYWLGTGTTDAAGSALGYTMYQFTPPVVNANVVRYGSAANTLAAGAMPASLGAVTGWGTANASTVPLIMFLV